MQSVSTRLEGDRRRRCVRRIFCLEQRIDTHGAREVFGRRAMRRLQARARHQDLLRIVVRYSRMGAISARSRSPMIESTSIASSSVRASSAASTGIFLGRMLRTAHRSRRIHPDDLADDQPVKQHPQRCQAQLYRRSCELRFEPLDVGDHVHGLDQRELADALGGASGRKAAAAWA